MNETVSNEFYYAQEAAMMTRVVEANESQRQEIARFLKRELTVSQTLHLLRLLSK